MDLFIVNKSLVLLMKKRCARSTTFGFTHLFLPHRVSIQNVSVCTLKTSPCVQAPRAHVETHVRVVPVYTGTFWTDTRGRGHGIFQRTTPHHTPHTQSNTIATTHGETCRDREREKEDREDKTTEEIKERRFVFSVVHGRSVRSFGRSTVFQCYSMQCAVTVSKFSELFSCAAAVFFFAGINSAQVFCGRAHLRRSQAS